MKHLFFALPCALLCTAALPAQQSAANAPAKNAMPHVFLSSSEHPLKQNNRAMAMGNIIITPSAPKPISADLAATFRKACSGVVLEKTVDTADYAVSLVHESGKGLMTRVDRFAVYARATGDKVAQKDTLSVDESAKDACEAIAHHWPSYTPPAPVPAPGITAPAAGAAPTAPAALSTARAGISAAAPLPAQQPATSFSIAVDSTPAGAEIEIDGEFAGSTPSTIPIALGKHEITIKQKGYANWTRTITLKGGDIHISANLDKLQ